MTRVLLVALTSAFALIGGGGQGVRPMTAEGRTAQEWFSDAKLAALADAAGQGQVEEVERLIREGVPVDGSGEDNETPLSFALTAIPFPPDGRNVKGVEALLEHGADPNHRVDDPVSVGGMPIIMLISHWRNKAPLLEAMLKHGCNPNSRFPVRLANAKTHPYEGDSLLIWSVRDLDSVKLLVKYGADVNLRPHEESDSPGCATAAVVAARLGQFDAVRFLVAHGTKDLDTIASTLQMLNYPSSLSKKRMELLKLLRERGARMYSGYKPIENSKIQLYPPSGIPQEWISPGYYEPKPSLDDKPVKIPQEWLNQLPPD